MDVLQIAMVSPDGKDVFRPLKPMSPRLQDLDDSQQLPIPHIIVLLRKAELLQKEGTGVALQRTAPIPASDVSTSTMNGKEGSG
jgi:hypothetical protein